MKLLHTQSVEQAREKLLMHLAARVLRVEEIAYAQACGRLLAADIRAGGDIPHFRRSTVDGYAVVAADTAAAGDSVPVFLRIKGQVRMGEAAGFSISPGECAEISTGGMLPDGADAVVMAEYSEPFGADGVALTASVAIGANAVRIGDDIHAGELLLTRGRRLLAQDIGALAAAGVVRAPVYKPPRLTLISTGDELVRPDEAPRTGQVRDINTAMLQAQAKKNGFEIVRTDVVRDDEALLARAVCGAMADSDIVAVSGGSSKGGRDVTRAVFDRVSNPGVFVHGLALKPGKPTILAYDGGSETLMCGLPGHPVSAMMVFELLLCRAVRELIGCKEAPAIPARLACNLASSPGMLTCWPAGLRWDGKQYHAEPVFGKSGLITTLTRADGYFLVSRNREGLAAGETVLIHLF